MTTQWYDALSKWGLLLVNIGTPEQPTRSAVRRFLNEFLSDRRVVDITPVLRKMLLHLVILPSRPKRVAEAYKKIWTERGSPLLVNGQELARRLRASLGWPPVELAMCYGPPTIKRALDEFQRQGVDRIIVFPLFPHNSSSAWGSAVEKVYQEAGRRWKVPSLQVVPPYFDHPAFIDAIAIQTGQAIRDIHADFLLMSFHGVPTRHCRRGDPTGGEFCLASESCCQTMVNENRNCYRAQCFATARTLADRLGVDERHYAVSFQSRFGGDRWLQPCTSELIKQLADGRAERLVVACPSFVTDCLETLEEIGVRGNENFYNAGGSNFRLVPSLNSERSWVDAIVQILGEVVLVPEQEQNGETQ